MSADSLSEGSIPAENRTTNPKSIESALTKVSHRSSPPTKGVRLGRGLFALWKLWLGSIFSTFFLLSILVVGWVTRAAQRETLRRWWLRSPLRTRGGTFAEFAAGDSATREHQFWPNWILGESTLGEVGRPCIRQGVRRIFGGLAKNARLGIQLVLNTAVLTLPGCLLWSVAWFAGWQNSFNKGYEHAWFGPSVFIFGMLLFAAAMAYVPLAQARQASTGDWRRFYDFRLVWRLVRRHWLASVGLAMVWAAGAGVVLLVKLAPALAQFVPNLVELSPTEALKVSQRFFSVMALCLFPLLVFLRLLAARVYSHALCSAVQSGAATEDDLGEYEWHALRRLELLTPRREPERRRWVRLAQWLATRTGQLSAGAAVFAIWFGFSFLIVISEFFCKTEFGRGWWNQPMIQLPWFDYTPNRMREAAKAGTESAETPSSITPNNSRFVEPPAETDR